MLSIRLVLWGAAFLAGCGLSLFHPLFGAMVYLLDYFQHPPLRWWGAGIPDLRFAQIAAVAWLGGYLLNGHSLLDKRILQHRVTWWLLGFLAVTILVTPFAVSFEISKQAALDQLKLVLLFFLIVGTVRTEGQFRLFCLAMVVGGFTWGAEAWLNPKRESGRLLEVGGPDSLNDNAAASVMLTLLPLIGMGLLTGKTWEKVIHFLCAPFILNTIILCNSRGTVLAGLGAGLIMLVLARGKTRGVVIALGTLGAAAFFFLMDPLFIERQLTTLKYEEDDSAVQRLETWSGGLRLIREHPLGLGGEGFLLMSPKYIPEVVARHGGENRSSHNTYLAVACDWGLPGFLCFMGFLGAAILTAHRVRRHPGSIGKHALAVEIALFGFAFNAFFTNRINGEVLYWLCALACCVKNLAHAGEPARAPAKLELEPCLTS